MNGRGRGVVIMRSLSPGINADHDEGIAEIGIVTRFSSQPRAGANVSPSGVNRALATRTPRDEVIVEDPSKSNTKPPSLNNST